MKNKGWKGVHNGGGGAVYGLGLIGALVYFISNAQTLEQGLIGVLKAIAWPAIFVFKLFEFLKI